MLKQCIKGKKKKEKFKRYSLDNKIRKKYLIRLVWLAWAKRQTLLFHQFLRFENIVPFSCFNNINGQ